MPIFEEHLNQLLYEQYRLLDFLEDQPTAVINGGTATNVIGLTEAQMKTVEPYRNWNMADGQFSKASGTVR